MDVEKRGRDVQQLTADVLGGLLYRAAHHVVERLELVVWS